jgi:hypothetical protein
MFETKPMFTRPDTDNDADPWEVGPERLPRRDARECHA